MPETPDAAAHVANNVRLLRARRGLSLGQLAARAEMSKGTLSKLETGAANPTLDTLSTLAGALAVPLHELFAAPRAGIEVVRAGEGQDLGEPDTQARLVHVQSRDGLLVEIHDMTIKPGYAEVSATHGEGSWEHVLVRSGRVRVGPIDDLADLDEGDYAVYPADRPHRWEGLGPDAARVWVVLTAAHPPRAS
jgi:transcriptional regulator with XRE-family HTH domain